MAFYHTYDATMARVRPPQATIRGASNVEASNVAHSDASALLIAAAQEEKKAENALKLT